MIRIEDFFMEIKTEELLEFIQKFSQQLKTTPCKHVAIDGKTIRNGGKKMVQHIL